MSFLREGLQVFFRCLGSDFQPTHQFLQGRANGSVGLTGKTTDEGTLWTAHSIQQDFFFECIGRGFLDGDTGACRVGLRPNTQFSGTRWRVADLPDPGTHVTLQCQGTGGGNCAAQGPDLGGFLDGHTAINDGNVFLAKSIAPPFSGTHWELLVAPLGSGVLSGHGHIAHIEK
jgi:hypothetical protein